MAPEMASSDLAVTSLPGFAVASDHRSSQLECFIVGLYRQDGMGS